MTSTSTLQVASFDDLPAAVLARAEGSWSTDAIGKLAQKMPGLLPTGVRTVLIDLHNAAPDVFGAITDLLRSADSRLIVALLGPPDELEAHLLAQKIPDYLIRIYQNEEDAVDGLSDATVRPLPVVQASRTIQPPMESWMDSLSGEAEDDEPADASADSLAATQPAHPAPIIAGGHSPTRQVANAVLDIEVDTPATSPGLVRLTLSGVLDAATVHRLNDLLAGLAERGITAWLFDMAGLQHVNSTGLGSMVRFADEVDHRGGRVVLARLSDRVRPVLDMLGLTRFFTVRNTIDEAMAWLTEPRSAIANSQPIEPRAGSSASAAPPPVPAPTATTLEIACPPTMTTAGVFGVTATVTPTPDADWRPSVRLQIPGCLVVPGESLVDPTGHAMFHVTPLACGTLVAAAEVRHQGRAVVTQTIPIVATERVAPRVARDLLRLGVGLLVIGGMTLAAAVGGAMAVATFAGVGGFCALAASRAVSVTTRPKNPL